MSQLCDDVLVRVPELLATSGPRSEHSNKGRSGRSGVRVVLEGWIIIPLILSFFSGFLWSWGPGSGAVAGQWSQKLRRSELRIFGDDLPTRKRGAGQHKISFFLLSAGGG